MQFLRAGVSPISVGGNPAASSSAPMYSAAGVSLPGGLVVSMRNNACRCLTASSPDRSRADDTTPLACYQREPIMSAPVDTSAAAGAAPVAHPEGFRKRRGQNWVFLGLMYGSFYMPRYNFSSISDAIGEQFGWTNSQLGT